MAIINSLLDTDLYKYTMLQSVIHKFPNVWVKYRFKCRNSGIEWADAMVNRISKEIDHYCTLMLTKDELTWISKLRYIKRDFVDFLRIYRPQREHVYITHTPGKGDLDIVVEGPWFLTILFEVPILAIVNEVYFDETRSSSQVQGYRFDGARETLAKKIEIARQNQFLFSDFGTRRRYSRDWQEEVVKTLADSLPRNIFGGTSNMHLAMKYNLVPIGTMAHEYICVGQALEGVTLASSQKFMLQAWVDEYRGDLGTALSDTLGTEKFLKDFDLYFAKLYDGVRHDSGDPIAWGEKMIEHYEALRIDPKNKQLVFSDGLDFDKAAEIYEHFKDRTRCSFGIGTNLTNDFEGVTPLNIVMKITFANGKPVAKLSNTPSKTMCEDEGFVTYLRKVIAE